MRAILQTLREWGSLLALLGATLARLPHVWRRRESAAEQLFGGAVQVVHVVLLVGFFAGMILALQTGIYLAQLGQQDQIGTIVSLSMAREMGPFITAVVVAATTGGALAAELGTMSVSEELAALEVMSIDRVDFLVLPRVVALAITCPLLTIVCDTVGILGGGLVASAQLGVELQLYVQTAVEALQSPGDVVPLPKDVYGGLLKSVVFGLLIATIACGVGLRTRGGALGVGRATRQAVRDSIIAIIVSNYFMTSFLYKS
ncbi:MAG TPA: ABC transporter permease [Planctomycetota bacterium]|nr:ABC transporter permease [Planctomycetota bacterium]